MSEREAALKAAREAFGKIGVCYVPYVEVVLSLILAQRLEAKIEALRWSAGIPAKWVKSKSCGCDGDPCAHIRLAAQIKELIETEISRLEKERDA